MSSLLRIVQSDPTDIFLTGNPLITYFKTVYRRYTNFSLEIKEEEFNNDTGFDMKSSLKIPKTGDLIHRMYLKVKLPEFFINKVLTKEEQQEIDNLKYIYNDIKEKYEHLKIWISYNYEEYKTITNLYNVIYTSQLTPEEINEILYNWYNNIEKINYTYKNKYTEQNPFHINNIISDKSFINYVNSSLNNKSTNQLFIYSQNNSGNICLISLKAYMNSLINTINEPTDNHKIDIAYDRCKFYIKMTKDLDYYYFNYLQSIKKELDLKNVNRYKFAWVEKIGHCIIDYVEITIGGQSIDKQYGFWLDIWHELNNNSLDEKYYNKLIGNVKILTEYNTDIKPEYTLYIPMNFWFCKNESLSLPLIALQYTDVIFNVKFKKFSECAYTSLKYEMTDNIIDNELQVDLLDNILISQNKNLKASLLVEYVYLDNAERKLFAKSAHEYLIEQTQIQQLPDINVKNKDIQLNFVHPCKGIIWFAQFSDKYINDDNTNKCLWCNYDFELIENNKYINNGIYNSIEKIKHINPFKYSRLTIEGRNISQEYPNIYYNYVIPYKRCKSTPALGINSYWFSLFPNELQPSGFCNFGYLREFKLCYELDVDEEYIKNRPYTITLLALNYNILRIVSGVGALAYI